MRAQRQNFFAWLHAISDAENQRFQHGYLVVTFIEEPTLQSQGSTNSAVSEGMRYLEAILKDAAARVLHVV